MSQTNKLVFYFNLVIVTVIATIIVAYAWTNPSQNPPDGTGVISIVNNNVGIGAPTPEGWAKLDVHTIPPNQGVHIWNSTEGGLLLGYQGNTIQGRTSADGNGDLILQKFGGNVGIGIPSPTVSRLHVYSGTDNLNTLRVENNNPTYAPFVIVNPSGWGIYDTATKHYFAGNVGIGTSDPGTARLKSVTGEGNAGWFTNSSPADYAALIVQNTVGGWGIYDNWSGKHYLSGNLGVGTVANYKLDVAGDINVGAVNVYRRGGTPGISASCPAGYVLKGAVVSGGIVTGGVCAIDEVGAGGGGDITDVVAGSGLTGGGTSGAVTLNVGAGTGISVAADSVSINTASALTWTGAQTFSGGASMGGTKIGNLGTPTLGTDAANKTYVDSKFGGGVGEKAWMTVESQICNSPVKIPIGCPLGWTSYTSGSYGPPDCSGGPAIGYRVCYKQF